MKKLLLMILALSLVLSLAACGGGSDNSNAGAPASSDTPLTRPSSDTTASTPPPSTTAPQMTAPDLGAAIGGSEILSEYDEASKQAMIQEAQEAGGNLEFKPDGSAVYTDGEGSTVIQNPDGTWTIEGDDGSTASVGGGWPDNEFTQQIPQPDFIVSIGSESADSFMITFSDATIEQIREYAEQIKNAGFTLDAETQDMEMAGMALYSYTAKNAAGYEINVFSASGTNGLEMLKP